MNDYRNWGKRKLVEKIEVIGGTVHPSWNLAILKQSYKISSKRAREVHVNQVTLEPAETIGNVGSTALLTAEDRVSLPKQARNTRS